MKIEIETNGNRFSFSPEEAKEVYKQLKDLFGDNDGVAAPIGPYWPWPNYPVKVGEPCAPPMEWTITTGDSLPQNPIATN